MRMTISPPVAEGGTRQWRSLTLLTVAVLLTLAPWFSAAAVAPLIQAEWQLTTGAAAWLTLAVQLGFVAGTLVSGVFNIPDRLDASRLFALSAAGAALSTAGLAAIAAGPLDGAVLQTDADGPALLDIDAVNLRIQVDSHTQLFQ